MYVTGDIRDFASRLHSLPAGVNDLQTFKNEASGYFPTYDINNQIKLQTEAARLIYNFSGNASLPIPSFF